jgi:SAM-dependent methyltransferase
LKNVDQWQPSKYRLVGNELRASNRAEHVRPGSRLVVECIAAFYDRIIPAFARGRLADLGCGNAPLYLKYRQYVDTITCIDWGNTAHKNAYLDVECDLNQSLPFADGAFDTIILSDVLEHLPQPELLWAEMHRLLVTGGHVLMNVPYFYPLHEIPFDFYRYSCYALDRFARNSGFEVIELVPLGGSPEVIMDIVAKHLQFIPLLGPALAVCAQAVTLAFVRTSIGRRISRKSSEHFPLGYAMVARRCEALTGTTHNTSHT